MKGRVTAGGLQGDSGRKRCGVIAGPYSTETVATDKSGWILVSRQCWRIHLGTPTRGQDKNVPLRALSPRRGATVATPVLLTAPRWTTQRCSEPDFAVRDLETGGSPDCWPSRYVPGGRRSPCWHKAFGKDNRDAQPKTPNPA